MIKVKRIDHVALATPSLDAAQAGLAAIFGLVPGVQETVAAQKTDVAFLHAGSTEGEGTAIELICPNGNEALARFVDKRGQALHHICFEVDDIVAALADLRRAGVALIDEVPRPGARGHLVAFLHPRATDGVLFELCQKVHAEGESR